MAKRARKSNSAPAEENTAVEASDVIEETLAEQEAPVEEAGAEEIKAEETPVEEEKKEEKLETAPELPAAEENKAEETPAEEKKEEPAKVVEPKPETKTVAKAKPVIAPTVTVAEKRIKPPIRSHKRGAKVELLNEPLYNIARGLNPIKKITGTYYIYDGKPINGRFRITDTPAHVGKDLKYVIGFIN